MARHKKDTPKDFGSGDYCYMEVTVEKKPKIEFLVDEQTGEVKPQLKKRENPSLITLPILIDPYGVNVFAANLFMRYLANQSHTLATLHTHIRALLLFYRWMYLEGKTIYDCTDEKESGVVYLFRDFLVDNLKRDSLDESGELVVEGVYEPSTGSTYIGTIIRYYEFLHVERIIRFSKDFVPFEYRTVEVKRKAKGNDHNILGHIKQNDVRVIKVETTGLRKPFGRVQTVASHHKLTPMLEDEKQTFYRHLNIKDTNFALSDDVKDLMLYTATETGLRVEELVTFPISEIRLPTQHEDVVKVTISEVLNGCKTKFQKQRTIEVPKKVMDTLFQYKLSKARAKAQSRSPVKHNALFLNPQQGLPFDTNTIQTYFGNVRREITEQHSNWHFTVHDLRATYATHWLYQQHQKRKVLFEVLIGELKDLMGHKSTETTEKYISYMNTEKYWLEFANRKNTYVSSVME